MTDFNKCKKAYESITPPEDLSPLMMQAMTKGQGKKHSSFTKRHKRLKIALTAFSMYVVLFFVLNSDTVFAKNLLNVPIIGDFLKIITVNFYEEEKEESLLHVTIPELKNTGYDDLENRINQEIRLRISEMIEAAEAEAKEYRQAYLETGGSLEDAWKMEIIIDYTIMCSNENFVSFVLTKTQSLASVYTENYYYNIDLSTGKTITLKDLFGPDYKNKLNPIIKEEMRKRFLEDNTSFFTKDDGSLDEDVFTGITDDQGFYINSDNTVTIVFPKYELAPGYRGETLFTIPFQY